MTSRPDRHGAPDMSTKSGFADTRRFTQLSLFTGNAISTDWPFGDLKPMSFGVIMADPPWPFSNWSKKGEGRNASQHYRTMSLEEIMALPVGSLAARDCALFLWCTGPLTNRIDDIMRAWGFSFKGKAFCWAKLNPRAATRPTDNIADNSNWFMSLGYGTRHNTEDCWLGTIGSPKRQAKDVRELIVAPVREHSRKPDEAFTRAERLFPGPYLELFSRQSRPGWSVFGDEVGKFDERAA